MYLTRLHEQLTGILPLMAKPLTRRLRKTALVSMVVIFTVGIPLSALHEIGHGIICNLEGNQFEFTITPFGGIGQCFGDIKNVELFLAMGGGLAAITASSIAIAVKRYKGILIGMITIAIGHLSNLVMETFAYEFYIQGYNSLMVTQVLLLAVWFGLILAYVKREANRVRLTA